MQTVHYHMIVQLADRGAPACCQKACRWSGKRPQADRNTTCTAQWTRNRRLKKRCRVGSDGRFHRSQRWNETELACDSAADSRKRRDRTGNKTNQQDLAPLANPIDPLPVRRVTRFAA